MSRYRVWKGQNAKIIRMLCYIRSRIAICKPACFLALLPHSHLHSRGYVTSTAPAKVNR